MMIDNLIKQYSNAMQKNEYSEATELARQIMNSQPQEADSYVRLSEVMLHQGDLITAKLYIEQAILIEPTNGDLYYLFANILNNNQQSDLAMVNYQQALRLDPEHVDAMWNYCEILRVNHHFEASKYWLERILELGHYYPALYHRLAVCYSSLGNYDKSIELFEKELAHEQVFSPHATKWSYSHVLLGNQDFIKGWEYYDSRNQFQGIGSITIERYDVPLWRGESLQGKRLFIHGEQGLGDEIMFSSVFPELIAEAKEVIIACQPPLARLFALSFPQATVVAHKVVENPADISTLGEIDYQSPICSIARYKGLQHEYQVDKQGIYTVDVEQQEWFEQHLTAMRGNRERRYRVGLMWNSNPSKDLDWAALRATQKSIPVHELEPLAQFADKVDFVSLQNHVSADQAGSLPLLDMLDMHPYLNDFADTAALMSCLDLVICVDTSVAHLAGCLGKDNWVLLKHNPDWRWLEEGDRNYWYESTFVFRQQQFYKWKPIIDQVCTKLDKVISC